MLLTRLGDAAITIVRRKNYGEAAVVQKNTSRIIIALLTCLMLGCAFVAVPFVHKHSLAEQVPLQDYDASCFFVKAEKVFY